MKKLQSILFVFLIFTFCSNCSAKESDERESAVPEIATYGNLTDYQRLLFDKFIDADFPVGTTLSQILTDHTSLRSRNRLAQALLFRNKQGDKENAIEILKWILKYQYKDVNSNTYGMWRTSVLDDRLDQNWREFVGCDLIITFHFYKKLLPDDLQKEIKSSLIRAAEGAKKRDVSPEYTNISIMSAFLMNYAGTEFQILELANAGLKKAQDIYTLFQRHQTFSEYNSPTYYGVTLVGLALWRELASPQIKQMGISLDKLLWEEIASSYNPNLKNMAGPYFRGYGMDMNKYFSITGICIAVALNNEKLAPLPPGKGEKQDELNNISPLLHLGLVVPENVLSQLKAYSDRSLTDRLITNHYTGDTLKRATAIVKPEWMMGGLWGNQRVWNQIKTGTIHWNNAEGEIEWLLVPGNGTTNVIISETSMTIYRAGMSSTELNIYVYAKELSESNFNEIAWKFQGMEFLINSGLKRSLLKITDPQILYNECAIAEKYPAVMKITFQIPSGWNVENPLLEIVPKK